MGVRREKGRGKFWYGTTPEIDFPIGKAEGRADAKRRARNIIKTGQHGTQPGERLTDVYWLEGNRFHV
jgi:hypothetical protein